MDERLGFGGGHYDYDEENLEHDDHGQEDHRLESYDENPGDLDHADDAAAVGFQEHDQVDHQLDHANDDSRRTNYNDKFDEWRKRIRDRRQGNFVPPDTRGNGGPVFARVKDLQASPPVGHKPDVYVPWYYDEEDDDLLRAIEADILRTLLPGPPEEPRPDVYIPWYYDEKDAEILAEYEADIFRTLPPGPPEEPRPA